MERTRAPGSVNNLHIDEDPANSIQGSRVTAEDRNALQEELVHVIEHAGLTPSRTNNEQVRQAIQVLAEDAGAIGEVMMFDGSGWQDNVTKPGWYACVPENENGGSAGLSFGITSMVDRFVMGRAVASAGATGGANDRTLAVANLPSHRHDIGHDHGPATTGNESNSHTHNVSGNTSSDTHSHTVEASAPSGYGVFGVKTGDSAGGGAGTSSDTHSHSFNVTSGGRSTSHTHTVDLPAYSGNSGYTGGGESFDNRPSFYSMLFIRKCEKAY